MKPGPLTAKRRHTHGEWHRTARVAQSLKSCIRAEIGPVDFPMGLTFAQREALDMILAKIARIVSGDPNHADHWHDIAGYALLAAGGDPVAAGSEP